MSAGTEMDRLYRACKAVADNIAEFDTITDPETADMLLDAVEAVFASKSQDWEMEQLARTVHSAWRDGMLNQGREVAENRMRWETLEKRDRELDGYIAEKVLMAVLGQS